MGADMKVQETDLSGAIRLDEITLERIAKDGASIIADQATRNIERIFPRRKGSSGRLRRSIIIDTVERDMERVVLLVGPSQKIAFYARFHEKGTSKMDARPFMRPAADEKMGETNQRIADRLRRFMEGGV